MSVRTGTGPVGLPGGARPSLRRRKSPSCGGGSSVSITGWCYNHGVLRLRVRTGTRESGLIRVHVGALVFGIYYSCISHSRPYQRRRPSANPTDNLCNPRLRSRCNKVWMCKGATQATTPTLCALLHVDPRPSPSAPSSPPHQSGPVLPRHSSGARLWAPPHIFQ